MPFSPSAVSLQDPPVTDHDEQGGPDWAAYYRQTIGREPRPLFQRGMKAMAAVGMTPGQAVEVEFGDGTETVALLRAGWSVLAIDTTPHAADVLRPRVPDETADRLGINHPLRRWSCPELDLLFAAYALSFLEPVAFSTSWDQARGRLRPGGFLVVNIFGVHDTWARRPDAQTMTFLDEAAVRRLVDGLQIVSFDEEDQDGDSFSGPKALARLRHHCSAAGSSKTPALGARVMRAVVQDRYGPPEVLRIEAVERPVPGDGEVLIRVRASTVSQTDTHLRGAHPAFWRLVAGWRRPRWRTLGVEFAGVVEGVGAGVTEFVAGDEIFGLVGWWQGAHAEYVCLAQSAPIARKPPNLSFEEAAAVCDGAMQALATLRVGAVGDGSRIVIYGASGSLGTAAVQIAKHLGAYVTGVTSTRNVELVRSLGADEVIDYTREDLTKRGPVFDVVIDAVGKYAYHWGRRALKPGGIYVETDFGPYKLETLVMAIATRWAGSRRLRFAAGRRSRADVQFMKELIESGAYRPVIDRTYPLEQVAEAHRYVETWHKTGNVVLTL